MASGNSKYSGDSRLPRVKTADRPYQVSPTDLRSSHYAVIPPVRGSNQSRNDVFHQPEQSLPGATSSSSASSGMRYPVRLLPDIGEPHPCPYYVTADVDLRPRPWATAKMSEEELFKMAAGQFSLDERFAQDVLAFLLMELISEDLAEEIAREVLQGT